MLVDDSIVARSVFREILEPHPEFAIIATASSAERALTLLETVSVDIVVLDIDMPGIGGLAALPEILRRGRDARVVILSSLVGAGAEASLRALMLGAADTLGKPRAGGFDDIFQRQLVDKLRRVANDVPVRSIAPAIRAQPPQRTALRPTVAGAVDCIAIGASTGGLHALSTFFAALPAGCTAPILITQHLPASFMPYFAAQMAAIAGRPSAVAQDGDVLRTGAILIAPGDAHIRLHATDGIVRIALDRGPAPSRCLPSVDPMLEAVAACYGSRGFGVILSGMGRDGTIGARRLVEAGGEIAVQDRATSVVWGMPGSIADAGLAATIAEPAQLAARLADRVGSLRRRPAIPR